MRIAVTSQDFQTVSGHAGRARHFLLFEVDGAAPPQPVGRLELAPEATVHEWQGRGAHPLDAVAAVLTRSFGEHFALHLARRGILAAVTEESEPLAAVSRLLATPDLGAQLARTRAGRCDHQLAPTAEAEPDHDHPCGCVS